MNASKKYVVYSNRESGTGRPDIVMKTPSVRGGAVILELKVVKDFKRMEEGCKEALRQIQEQNYEAALLTEGYSNIKKYGVCFYQKECLIREMNNETIKSIY